MNNLIKYHHLGNLLIKVLNWFLFGKRSGKAFLPVSEKLGSSPLRQASERQISSLRRTPGAAFRNPGKPDLSCLSGFLLVTLSWVGSLELAFSNLWKPDPPCLSGFLPYGLFRGRVSCVGSQQNARPPCPSPTPGVYSKSCPFSQWCHPTISSSVIPFSSHLQSFPASGSFPKSRFFPSGGQSTGVSASASVLPMNVQDWFPLGGTDWSSLLSKRLSIVFSNTTVQKHQFFSAQLSL